MGETLAGRPLDPHPWQDINVPVLVVDGGKSHAAVRVAADALGNTPAVCQRAYVHPAVLEATAEPLANRRIRALFARTTRARDGLDRHERALLRYLRARA
jgi:DNA topoisomerase IB